MISEQSNIFIELQNEPSSDENTKILEEL